jgi:hypothetical protein
LRPDDDLRPGHHLWSSGPHLPVPAGDDLRPGHDLRPDDDLRSGDHVLLLVGMTVRTACSVRFL